MVRWNGKRVIAGMAIAVALIAAVWIFRAQFALILRLLLLSSVAAFLLSPLCEWLSRRMSRTLAVALCFVLLLLGLAALVLLLLPPMLDQARELVGVLPEISGRINGWLASANDWLSRHGMPEVSIRWEAVWERAMNLAGGTASMAGSVFGVFAEIGLMLPLAFYLLRDKERVLLHMELAVPSRMRRTVLRVAASVRHELSLYVRGQLTVALLVGLISAIGLLMAGVRAWLVLGLVTGIFNLIPYFGPLLGGIPTVLMALSQGLGTVLHAVIVLVLVQQIDGYIISPHVTGSSTGFHPVWVLVGITLGGSFAGIGGMLFAVPVMLVIRAIMRIWVMRYEKV